MTTTTDAPAGTTKAPQEEGLDHSPDSPASLNTGRSNVQSPREDARARAEELVMLHVAAFNARVFVDELHRIGEKSTVLLCAGTVDQQTGADLSEQFASLLGGLVDWCDDVEALACGRPVAREAKAKPEPSAIASVPRTLTNEQQLEADLRRVERDLRITTQSLVRMVNAFRRTRHELERLREDEAERAQVPPDDDGCAGPFASMAEALGASS